MDINNLSDLTAEQLEEIAGGVSFDELKKVAEALEKRRNPGQQTVGGIADGHSFGPTQETEDNWMNQR